MLLLIKANFLRRLLIQVAFTFLSPSQHSAIWQLCQTFGEMFLLRHLLNPTGISVFNFPDFRQYLTLLIIFTTYSILFFLFLWSHILGFLLPFEYFFLLYFAWFLCKIFILSVFKSLKYQVLQNSLLSLPDLITLILLIHLMIIYESWSSAETCLLSTRSIQLLKSPQKSYI